MNPLMRHSFPWRLVGGSVLALSLALAPAPGQAAGESWTDPVRFANEIFRLTNEARATNNLPAFHRDARLDAAAQRFSEYMGTAGFFHHVGPDGVTVPQREAAQGYRGMTWGENIAWGYPTPREVVDGWLKSPGHRANLLNQAFHDLGVGVAVVKGRVYMTQDFGTLPGRQ
jgi:uncharacterized protein YkwD